MYVFLVAQMFPGVILLIPLFGIFTNLKLIDTPWALIISYATFAIPFCILMLKSFFDTIPYELEEAGRVDGLGRLRDVLADRHPAVGAGPGGDRVLRVHHGLERVPVRAVVPDQQGRAHAAGRDGDVHRSVQPALGPADGRIGPDHDPGHDRVLPGPAVPDLRAVDGRGQGLICDDARLRMTVDTPAWVRDAVFYQIFPDRFAASSARSQAWRRWSRGTRRRRTTASRAAICSGSSSTSTYLADLGRSRALPDADLQSASNHRYHTYDYLAVDPLLGGDAALRELLDAAHERGMRVVLDGVFNHTGRGFWPFHHVLEAGAASPYRSWFHLDDAALERRPRVARRIRPRTPPWPRDRVARGSGTRLGGVCRPCQSWTRTTRGSGVPLRRRRALAPLRHRWLAAGRPGRDRGPAVLAGVPAALPGDPTGCLPRRRDLAGRPRLAARRPVRCADELPVWPSHRQDVSGSCDMAEPDYRTTGRVKYAAVNGADDAFSPAFCAYLVALVDLLGDRVHAMRAARRVVLDRALYDHVLPSFPDPSPASESHWQVPPVPADLLQSGIEISGPCSVTRMFINALNPGPEGERAVGDLDDDEDSSGHRLEDTVRAALNRSAAVRRELRFSDPERARVPPRRRRTALLHAP